MEVGRDRLRKHNLNIQGQMVLLLWESWLFYSLKSYGLDFKIKYTLMDSFTYFKVVFYFLLPVFFIFQLT